MSTSFLNRLACGRAAERGDAAIAARSTGVPLARLAVDLGDAAAGQAVLVERLFGARRAARPDAAFRRQLESRILSALPTSGDAPAAAHDDRADLARLGQPIGYLRPLLLGAGSLALGTLLLLDPGSFASDMAAAPTALAATARPEGGPTVTFTPEARATDDARHARRLVRLTSAGG